MKELIDFEKSDRFRLSIRIAQDRLFFEGWGIDKGKGKNRIGIDLIDSEGFGGF